MSLEKAVRCMPDLVIKGTGTVTAPPLTIGEEDAIRARAEWHGNEERIADTTRLLAEIHRLKKGQQ